MVEECVVKNTGLRGVTVADTKISFIDGTKGILIYRGYRIEDLARNSTFEETAYLLLKGELPDASEMEDFKDKLALYSTLPDYVINSMKTWPVTTNPMHTLMSGVAMLGFEDSAIEDEVFEDHVKRAIKLITQLPMLMTAWDRIRRGLEPVAFNPALTHAENILYQLTGEEPDKEVAKSLDICLILHADHTFNASTFACREVVSTKADMYAGAVAGLAALSGPLHGGANERVMQMLMTLENEPHIEDWVKKRIEKGKVIMGLGHAVYKTEDPRALFLKEMGKQLGDKLNQPHWNTMLKTIETSALALLESKGKTGIKPNVDFYSAPVYHLIGLPHDLFTPIFAVSRIAGWASHMLEEQFGLAQEKPALYRPSAQYVGNYCGLMGCEYKKKQ
jgi:citrate synthase